MYEEMTFENIMDSMLSRISDSMDKREGSIIYDATAAVAYHMASMYFQLVNFQNLVMPDTSAGEYLSRMAKMFGLERKSATKAVREGVFDKELPDGSRFSTSRESVLIFAATNLVKSESGNYIYEMECETPGTAGNDYIGTLIPVEYISGLGTAELSGIISAGTDEESDDSLRQRILARARRPSTSGNVNDYYNWAMSCSGIGAAKIFPLAEGPGTVKVVIASEDKSAVDAGMIRNVSDYIEKLRPIGATVAVVSATEKEINISAKVKLSSETSLGAAQNAFTKSADEYLKQNAFATKYISLAKIGYLLMEINGIEDFTDLKLNGEEVNITLSDEEIAVCGAVRLEVM